MTTVLMSLAAMATAMSVSGVVAQTVREIRGPAGVIPLAGEPPAKTIIDPPLPDALARGLVVIQYRTENLRTAQVFGRAALDVSPRIGHIHVTLDDAPWRWADASGEPLILQSLPPGPHKVLIQLADPTHRVIDQGVVELVIPER
ncbi:MAG: DUF6130 family protein [Methylocella sp.]